MATDEETRMNVSGIEVFEYFINELRNEDCSHHVDLCEKAWWIEECAGDWVERRTCKWSVVKELRAGVILRLRSCVGALWFGLAEQGRGHSSHEGAVPAVQLSKIA